jgi:hypothetical protein
VKEGGPAAAGPPSWDGRFLDDGNPHGWIARTVVGHSGVIGRPAAAVVSLAVLVGAAGAAAGLNSRGGDDLFLVEQSSSLTLRPTSALSAAAVEAVAALAPEPVPSSRRTRPAQVLCRPIGAGALRDPWLCAIQYRSGTRAHYRIVVQPDGRYSGVGTGVITGCCVKVPTLE